MKTKILIFMLFLSFLASSLSSCQDEISDATGTWVCIPEPDVTITLTFKRGIASVTFVITSLPQDSIDTSIYLFYNEQFTVRGNKLYTIDPVHLTPPSVAFIGTMLSFNRMSLHYVGELDDSRLWVRDYIFERK